MVPFSTKALETIVAAIDVDGYVPIKTWVQAPTPTTAAPYKPSMVTWHHGMCKDAATRIIKMAEAMIALSPDF